MNNSEKIKEKWARGELCIGTNVAFTDAAVSELFGEAGYDFVWIDMEHSAMSLADALGHVRAARASGAAPWIRVPSNDPVVMKPILELHPAAVIVPRIGSAKDAEAAVTSCRYPPRGVRGYGPSRGVRFGARSMQEYLEQVDSEVMLILQIEHIDAVSEIETILGTPGVDSVVTGPSDLSASMGLLGQPGHPDVIAAIERIFRVAREKKVPAGHSIGYSRDAVRRWLGHHLSWIAFDGDWITLFKHAKSALDEVRRMAAEGA
jgi:2-keto-3-deoxy-L-rhamnonate aldolase RhmA